MGKSSPIHGISQQNARIRGSRSNFANFVNPVMAVKNLQPYLSSVYLSLLDFAEFQKVGESLWEGMVKGVPSYLIKKSGASQPPV